jgi:ferredoxin
VPEVIIQPKGIEIDVEEGETIFDAARRLGYRWPTVCGGIGDCSTCFMTVIEGAEHLSAITRYEQEGIDRLDIAENKEAVRLACQAKVTDTVVVNKRGVRKIESNNESQ